MLKFGLIGCGRVAKRHAELLGLGQIAGAQLAAVCDCIEERACAFGEKYGIPWFTNMHKMLDKSDLNVVSILTPSGLHAEHLLAVAPYKKHVVLEKPMALTLDDADAMIQACDENGIRLFVVKQNRFNVPVQKLWQARQSGRFGRLVLGTVRVRWCRTQAYYDQDSWRGTWAYDGGVLTNQASHHVDLLEWMMGEIDSVFAKSTTALVNVEVSQWCARHH
jgi:predicted dehydrogenase